MSIQQLSPPAVWQWLQSDGRVSLIDVRDPLEVRCVGAPLGAITIPYKLFPDLAVNPDFLAAVEAAFPDRSQPLCLICRTGQRSLAAAEWLASAGYLNLTNVSEGFEGRLNDAQHRSSVEGWRFHGLPWQQS